MISLPVFFWIFVVLFAIVGAIRGWAKEIMVTFSGIVAIFIIAVLLPLINKSLSASSLFWAQMIIFMAVIFFGYQTPNFRRLAESGRFVRDTLRDSVFGVMLGAINGYMIVGSLWYYLDKAGYPLTFITAPDAASSVGVAAANILKVVAPVLLGGNVIFFAVGIAFVIVLVMFI